MPISSAFLFPNQAALSPVVFFDRDGVVNQSPAHESGYVLTPNDFRFTEGIKEVLYWLRSRGWRTILVTSQRCVGKGLISAGELAAIHEAMQEELGDSGRFDAIYVFTGLPGSESWEKPKPGMVLAAASDWGVDLGNSWLIGDADRDIEMARRAGIGRTVLFLSEKEVGVPADFTVASAGELLALMEAELGEGRRRV